MLGCVPRSQGRGIVVATDGRVAHPFVYLEGTGAGDARAADGGVAGGKTIKACQNSLLWSFLSPHLNSNS